LLLELVASAGSQRSQDSEAGEDHAGDERALEAVHEGDRLRRATRERVIRARRGDRRERRDPECAADLLRRVDQA
jgi:hypothetical protein